MLLARLSLAQDCPARALALLEGVPDQSLLQGQALYRLGRYPGGIGASALCRGSGNTGRGSSYLAAAGGLLPGVWRLPGRL